MNNAVLFDTESAAEYLGGFSKKTLERWRIDGNGPRYRKIGHFVRYTQEALDEFMAGDRRSTSEYRRAG